VVFNFGDFALYPVLKFVISFFVTGMQGLLMGCYTRQGFLMSCYRKAWGSDLLDHKKAWVIATRFCPRGTRYMLMLSNADYSSMMDVQQFVVCR
jgi:hypothetical protein